MQTNRIHLSADGGDGNGGNTFLATLPEEVRGEASLASFKDSGALAKSYVEAQKLIGSKRIALPGEKAAEAEWEGFYNSIGRPETFDKYEDVVLKNEKGETLMIPDKTESAELKKFFYKMGLTGRQAKMMQEYSLNYLHKGRSASDAAQASSSQAGVDSLKREWGDKFETNVDVARSVVKKFGGENAGEIEKFLDTSGLGNHPQLVKLFSSIGASIMEDTGRRGPSGGGSLPVTDRTRAVNEIENLKTEKEFQDALLNPNNVGHKAAVARWLGLHSTAYPGQEAG